MRITLFLALVILSTGCSGDDAEPCDLAHRDGTYLQVHTERSGNCGAVADQVVILDGDDPEAGLPPGCTADAPNSVSADQCDLTRKFTCPLDGVPGTVSITAITSEEAGGARLSGIVTFNIKDGDGAPVCLSTYDMTATRQ